ncbi:MAG: ribosome assembly protein YihI (activator of Der GTPase) [Alphaproteobacteria bacterium]|jgi:ribosome assembly protein YihI (activator of Der GTPase)
MSRKKSRTEDRIGIPKSKAPRVINTVEKPKARSGNKPGTRQKLAEAILASTKKQKQDPRSGSKKPIDLSKYVQGQEDAQDNQGPVTAKVTIVEPVKYRTPQAEFEAIEADNDLEMLLEKQEVGKLKAAEQAYVDKMTARYRVLCELMGIDVDEYTQDSIEENEQEDDPFAKLDAIKMDDFKD